MSFLGSKKLAKGITIEKKRFGPKQDLRFGNALFLTAYDPNTLEQILTVDQLNAKCVFTGETSGAIVVAIGPANVGFVMKDATVVNVVYDMKLESNTHCLVLEGAVTINDVIYSADNNIPYITADAVALDMKIFGTTKLLLFKVE